MIKLLGIIDVLSAILLFLLAFQISIAQKLVLIFALYLIIKSLIFLISSKDIASIFDLAGGILFILSLFIILPKALLIIVAILMFQKGIFSLLG